MSHDFEYVSKQTRALCRELERHGWNVVRDDALGTYHLVPDEWLEDFGHTNTGMHREFVAEHFKSIADAARMGLALIEQGQLEEGRAG